MPIRTDSHVIEQQSVSGANEDEDSHDLAVGLGHEGLMGPDHL